MSDLSRFKASERERLRAARAAEKAALKRVERAEVALTKARVAVKEATSHLENAAVALANECARWERAKERTNVVCDEAGVKP